MSNSGYHVFAPRHLCSWLSGAMHVALFVIMMDRLVGAGSISAMCVLHGCSTPFGATYRETGKLIVSCLLVVSVFASVVSCTARSPLSAVSSYLLAVTWPIVLTGLVDGHLAGHGVLVLSLLSIVTVATKSARTGSVVVRACFLIPPRYREWIRPSLSCCGVAAVSEITYWYCSERNYWAVAAKSMRHWSEGHLLLAVTLVAIVGVFLLGARYATLARESSSRSGKGHATA